MSWLSHPLIHMSQQVAFSTGVLDGLMIAYFWFPHLYKWKQKRKLRKLLQERDAIRKLIELEL